MTADVAAQLQRVSGLQGGMRDMRNRLTAFHEVLRRREEALASLRGVYKLPAAYRCACDALHHPGSAIQWCKTLCGMELEMNSLHPNTNDSEEALASLRGVYKLPLLTGAYVTLRIYPKGQVLAQRVK